MDDKRLPRFGLLQRIDEIVWSSKCRIIKVSSFYRRRSQKTWNEVIRSDLKEWKVSKDIAKGTNAWNSFIRNCSIHTSMIYSKQMLQQM